MTAAPWAWMPIRWPRAMPPLLQSWLRAALCCARARPTARRSSGMRSELLLTGGLARRRLVLLAGGGSRRLRLP
eukprot:15473115-Alexandrium_andersonii.AAC.1